MAVRTASGGKAQFSTDNVTYTDIPEVRTWDLTITSESKEYASSSTAGGKRRIAGAEDFSGTVSIYHDATSRIHDMGIKGGLTGYLKLFEDSGETWIAPVYIEDTSVNTDVEGGEIIDGQISFSRNGALTYP